MAAAQTNTAANVEHLEAGGALGLAEERYRKAGDLAGQPQPLGWQELVAAYWRASERAKAQGLTDREIDRRVAAWAGVANRIRDCRVTTTEDLRTKILILRDFSEAEDDILTGDSDSAVIYRDLCSMG